MKNQGKIFEQDFKKSIDLNNPDLFYYRFKDGTANWGGSNNPNVRFQHNNISDLMIFYKGNLFILELKSHHGKSLPFSCIRKNQFEEMYDASFKKKVHPFVIILFVDINECYAVKMTDIIRLRDENKTKSMSLSFCIQHGLKIDSRKLQTHYRFEVLDFLENYIK